MTDAGPAHPTATRPERLHQPIRLVVALMELLLAVAAGWAAAWCWSDAVSTLRIRTADNAELVSRIYEGDRIGLAFAASAVAGLLVVDAARQTVLGVRTRRRRRGRASRPARPADTR